MDPRVVFSQQPGVDFTNILHIAFICADPKAQKRLTASLYFLRFRDLHV